jgi:probable F420-dependent oxidoreductase
MKVDGGFGLASASLGGQVDDEARSFEEAGYDGIWSAETSHDPFLPLAFAARVTDRVDLGTGIAVAFARNPMTVANITWDLQALSGGRFILGLGSQIKPHITKRFSMPWSEPAARMREFILATRAILDGWQTGERVNFRGDFYTHTLMTPFFDPGPNPHGIARFALAAVGERMTEVAGEVADGFVCHSFTTEDYLRDVTMPALQRGLAKAGRDRSTFEISGPAFVVTGADEEAMAASATAVRQQIAFYGSTPAYKGVLEHHGWDDVHPELNRLSKEGKWKEMGDVIDDELLNAFAVVAEPTELAAKVHDRWGGVSDRLSFYAPYRTDPGTWLPVIEALKSA